MSEILLIEENINNIKKHDYSKYYLKYKYTADEIVNLDADNRAYFNENIKIKSNLVEKMYNKINNRVIKKLDANLRELNTLFYNNIDVINNVMYVNIEDMNIKSDIGIKGNLYSITDSISSFFNKHQETILYLDNLDKTICNLITNTHARISSNALRQSGIDKVKNDYDTIINNNFYSLKNNNENKIKLNTLIHNLSSLKSIIDNLSKINNKNNIDNLTGIFNKVEEIEDRVNLIIEQTEKSNSFGLHKETLRLIHNELGEYAEFVSLHGLLIQYILGLVDVASEIVSKLIKVGKNV